MAKKIYEISRINKDGRIIAIPIRRVRAENYETAARMLNVKTYQLQKYGRIINLPINKWGEENRRTKVKQGGIPDSIWNDPSLQSYLNSGSVGGYVGDFTRTIQSDRKLVNALKNNHLTDHEIAVWITSTSGRHLMDDGVRMSHLDDYAKRAHEDISRWDISNDFVLNSQNKYAPFGRQDTIAFKCIDCGKEERLFSRKKYDAAYSRASARFHGNASGNIFRCKACHEKRKRG